jgi:hypothetical protein
MLLPRFRNQVHALIPHGRRDKTTAIIAFDASENLVLGCRCRFEVVDHFSSTRRAAAYALPAQGLALLRQLVNILKRLIPTWRTTFNRFSGCSGAVTLFFLEREIFFGIWCNRSVT